MVKVREVFQPDGNILQVQLEDIDLKDMMEKDKTGDRGAVILNPPNGTVLVKQLQISYLPPKQARDLKAQEIIQEELAKKKKDDKSRAERYNRLSPCCGTKMAHNDNDPDGVMTCIQCETKYKNSGGSWLSLDKDSK